MKKILCIILLFIFSISLTSCNESNLDLKAIEMNHEISSNITNMEGSDDFSEETIKAMAVILRTQKYLNISNANENVNIYNSDEDSLTTINKNYNLNKINLNSSSYETKIDSVKNDRILKLVESTNNQIIEFNDNSNSANVLYTRNSDDLNWKKDINKSDILKYLSNNKISLSNITNFKPYFSEDNKLTYIEISGKKISYLELKNIFNIPSSNITKIENNSTCISIYGTDYDNNYFDITKANNLAKNNYDYKQLLNHFFNDFNYKTI